jgi:hypothetical protein
MVGLILAVFFVCFFFVLFFPEFATFSGKRTKVLTMDERELVLAVEEEEDLL